MAADSNLLPSWGDGISVVDANEVWWVWYACGSFSCGGDHDDDDGESIMNVDEEPMAVANAAFEALLASTSFDVEPTSSASIGGVVDAERNVDEDDKTKPVAAATPTLPLLGGVGGEGSTPFAPFDRSGATGSGGEVAARRVVFSRGAADADAGNATVLEVVSPLSMVIADGRRSLAIVVVGGLLGTTAIVVFVDDKGEAAATLVAATVIRAEGCEVDGDGGEVASLPADDDCVFVSGVVSVNERLALGDVAVFESIVVTLAIVFPLGAEVDAARVVFLPTLLSSSPPPAVVVKGELGEKKMEEVSDDGEVASLLAVDLFSPTVAEGDDGLEAMHIISLS